ncbi:hypothetical protein Zmor_014516 [Zophobas morio]|uniref:Uncharacterized protein n=1 Tax=Zophobas morio TaxID=2755281 RepID=A0AA38IHN9_9CUCU|nr:hypothetical protein Zmor_014516 [Zophobas morio]
MDPETQRGPRAAKTHTRPGPMFILICCPERCVRFDITVNYDDAKSSPDKLYHISCSCWQPCAWCLIYFDIYFASLYVYTLMCNVTSACDNNPNTKPFYLFIANMEDIMLGGYIKGSRAEIYPAHLYRTFVLSIRNTKGLYDKINNYTMQH